MAKWKYWGNADEPGPRIDVLVLLLVVIALGMLGDTGYWWE